MFDAAKKLKAAGHATCGFSNAWVTWVNVEQFSAWHNVPIATKANGLDGFDTVLKFNRPLHVKHLQNLIDLQKDKTYDYSGRTNTGEGRFTSGECPIFLTSSGSYGNAKGNAKFDFTSAPMPYYPDVAGAPQNSIIGGASLWVMGGKKPEEYKGVAKFFAFLSDTDRQATAAQGVRLPADHQGGLREDQGRRLLQEEPDPGDAAAGTDQQGADREFARPALWQHGADARRLGRGNRGRARGQEDREGGARRRRVARQCDAAAVRKDGQVGNLSSSVFRAERAAMHVKAELTTRATLLAMPKHATRPEPDTRSEWKNRAVFNRSKLLPYALLRRSSIITFVFFYWPASQAVWQSFQLQDAFGLVSEFVGLENYQALFAQPEYYKTMLTTLVFSTLVAGLSLSIALLLASQADKNLSAAPASTGRF